MKFHQTYNVHFEHITLNKNGKTVDYFHSDTAIIMFQDILNFSTRTDVFSAALGTYFVDPDTKISAQQLFNVQN